MTRCDECKFYVPCDDRSGYLPDGDCHLGLPPWVKSDGRRGVMKNQGCDLGQPVEAHR
jgi:hypothetical protein